MDLLNRALIAVTGADRLHLLQKLVTQDLLPLQNLAATAGRYTLLLTPQGRYAFDFFVATTTDGAVYIDAPAHRADALVATLEHYRLRSDAQFRPVQPAALAVTPAPPADPVLVAFPDSRDSRLGWRVWQARDRFSEDDAPAVYKNTLVECGVIEPSYEMTTGQDLPLEYGLHNAAAISFTKGCYIGQELTARTHNKGLIKNRISVVSCDALHAMGTPVLNAAGVAVGHVVRARPPFAIVRTVIAHDAGDALAIGGVAGVPHKT